MDNDAKSCYDRIICNLAMIVSQYFGVSRKSASVQAKTLRKMRYRLRTAIGDSKHTYKHTKSTPIHGTGQGSCSSPSIWLMISSILMDCLAELSGGMTMQDVDGLLSIQQWIDGFVDDTSLFSNILNILQDSLKEMTEQLKHDMIKWKELLEASGGKLELTKCFYYILSWKFDMEGNAIPESIREQREKGSKQIIIRDSNNSSYTTIMQKEVSDAHKTLGCYKAIDGQIKYLKTKSDQFGHLLINASLTRKQALMAYKMVYLPSLQYGLPATSITPEQINIIQNYALDKFLPYMGYEHGSKRTLIHGPIEMGGANISHMYTEMMGMKLECFMAHIRANTVLGKSFRINLNYIQLISGLDIPIFESHVDLGYIDNNWILHLRSYLNTINSKLFIRNIWVPTKLRESDSNLMTSFMSLKLSNHELRLINNWRIFYKVNYLSEICNPEGNKVQEQYLNRPLGSEVEYNNCSTLEWPLQSEPGPKGFSLWLKCLKHCYNMQSNGVINYKLGIWHSSYITSKSTKWSYYYHIPTSMLFYPEDDYYVSVVSDKVRKSSMYLTFRSERFTHKQLPDDCVPARIASIRDKNLVIKFHSSQYINITKQCDNEWDSSIIQNLNIISNTNIIALKNNPATTIHIISDGGVYDYDGTYGVIISDGTTPVASNLGKLYSVAFQASSFRSEMFSMLAGIRSFLYILKAFNINPLHPRKLLLYSDNKILIRKVNRRRKSKRTVNQHRDSDVDLELQLLHDIEVLTQQNWIVEVHYVRSHQEVIKAKDDLSHEESMNILADSLCKEARSFTKITKYEFPPINPISLVINKEVINSKYAYKSKMAYHSIPLRSYYKEKYSWKDNTINNIWWQVYYRSLSSFNQPDKQFIFKFIHDKLPSNERDNKYYSFRDKHCKQCQSDIENEDHILRCNSISRKHLRDEWCNELQIFLVQKYTPINVATIILNNVRSWLEMCEVQIPYDNDESVSKAIIQQNNIGWRHFIRGRISIEWGNLINNHIDHHRIKDYNAEKWGAALLAINWKFIIKIWRQRCSELHGISSTDIETNKKVRLLQEIRHIQSSNKEIMFAKSNWIHEDLLKLEKLDSLASEAWVYGAKIVSKINQQRLRSRNEIFQERGVFSGTKGKTKDKSELDPGEYGFN